MSSYRMQSKKKKKKRERKKESIKLWREDKAIHEGKKGNVSKWHKKGKYEAVNRWKHREQGLNKTFVTE